MMIIVLQIIKGGVPHYKSYVCSLNQNFYNVTKQVPYSIFLVEEFNIMLPNKFCRV
jgi:hypothetical protein